MFCVKQNNTSNGMRMVGRVVAVLAVALLLVLPLHAQVTVTARLDSLQMFVGQQDGLELEVSMPAGKNLQLPALKKGMEIVPDVEIVDVGAPDTVRMNDGKQLQVTQRYVITAWDSSFYYLPPMQVMVDSTVYESKPLALKVYTLDVDTLNAEVFFPPRNIQELPFSWDDWKQIAYSLLAILPLVALIVAMSMLIKKGKPIFRIIRRKKKIPAHQVAISEIERIKAQRTWAQEDSKEYYTLLTDALRTYIQERYSFSAMEMTSSEIIERLTQDGDQKSLDELREIFRTADLVKFAKWSTQINENDANLVAALQYVNETKVEEDANAKTEPEVVKETDKQRQLQVIVMRVIIVISAIVIAFILGTVVWRLYDMFA
ncbi:MAG: hypothetical protein IJZ11_08990 [Bacteroidaceae bacterium]|nr:hypothetical protein [Bacteroidaceae bacterium]